MRTTGLVCAVLASLFTVAPVKAQSVTNGKVTVQTISRAGKIVGFAVQPLGSDARFDIYLGTASNIWAGKAYVEKGLDPQRLVIGPLSSSPTPKLGANSLVAIELRPDDPYPIVSFTLQLQAFDKAAWQRTFGTVPFHFLAMPMPGAQIFYHRGWQIPTPVTDPYPMQGNQTGYGKQIRSEWDDDWTYAPPLGAHPMPDVGLWWPARKLFACYDFHAARLLDHTEKDIATAYVWKQNDLEQFVTLAWPFPWGYRETLRYPEELPATVASHFHFLYDLNAGPDRDPNLIVQEFVRARYGDLLPDVPRVTDLSWLPDAHRPGGFGPVHLGRMYDWVQPGTGSANWWKPGSLVFSGVGWDRPEVDYVYAAGDQASIEAIRDNVEFMAPRVTWMTIDGERCCAWQQCLEGEGADMFGDGVPSTHNAQNWQMALLFLDAYRNDPATYGKYLDIIDGQLMWSKHFLYTRNDYADVPCAQFCWSAAPVTAYCLRYYYTFRNDPARREKAELAYRLARNAMYHFLPTWLSDNDEMDNVDAFSFCEPNAGISWLGAACSNEVLCVTYAAIVTYLATGDPWLGHYIRGACERWHELFRDEWYPTVRQYGDAFTEIYYLYPGRGPVGGRVTFGGLWGGVEWIAWPIGEATVRVTCGEKAALAWNRAPGMPPLTIEADRVVRTGPPDPNRVGSHTDIADYRYYGDGQGSFRLVRYGLGQPEPFTVNVTFPMFDLRGKPVILRRNGQEIALEKGRDYEEMPFRWDTVVVRGCRYGDVIGIGKIDESAAVLPCEIHRVRTPEPPRMPEGFAAADLRAAANRRLSTDWEDPDSWAGLDPGLRYIYGVPFHIIDANLNDARLGLRDGKAAVSLQGRHFFALVGEIEANAKLTVTAGGKTVDVDLKRAVPALKGWPPCFDWELFIVEASVPGRVTAISTANCTLFAATVYQGQREDPKLAAILKALRAAQEEAVARARAIENVAKLAPLFEKASGHIAILPTPQDNPRGSTLATILQKARLLRHVTFLSPQQLVDPDVFKAERFWIAFYLGGETYYQSVNSAGDGDRALQRYLAQGGTLVVLPHQPFPFYYNEAGKPVVSAPKFGLPICGSGAADRLDMLQNIDVRGWEKAPRDRKFTFAVARQQEIVKSLPASFAFPLSEKDRPVDERWRPIVNVVGEDNKYVPLISLADDAGKSYGDGAAFIEYRTGPYAPGRVLYVWSTLLAQPELREPLLLDILGWVLANTVAPPAAGLCYFTHKPITVDGKLDEAAWQEVPAFELQKAIRLEGGPNQPTRVKVRWDKEYLYVGFECEDSDVWATMRQRDQHLWEEEVVEVFVDHDGDGRNYKEFEVNPLNTVVDLNIVRPGHPNFAQMIGWNSAGWKTAVSVDGTVDNRGDRDRGWVCEMAIPLADLAPAYDQPRPGTTWRVNFYRIDRPDPKDPNKDIQFSAWSPTRRSYHEPERFGLLTFAADPFDEDFSLHERGAAPGPPWVVAGGEWQVTQDGLVGRDGGNDAWTPMGLRGGLPNLQDYRLTVRFEVMQLGSDWRDGPWFGVRCRGTDGYFVEFTNREVQVHKSYQGHSTNDVSALATWPRTLAPGPHELIIEVRGSDTPSLTVLLDGQTLGTATDRGSLGLGPMPAGGIALSPRRWSNSQGHTIVRYRSIRIEPVVP